MMKTIKASKLAIIAVFLVIGIMMPVLLSAVKALAATESKGYLILVEEKDGTWSSYENYVEVKSNDKLMVNAYSVAKAVGIKYKRADSKNFMLSNGKKVNTYTKGTVKYKFNNSSKSVTKNAAYKPYTSTAYNANMVEYSSLATLINVKYYKASEAGDYQKAGYQGVICLSLYHKITSLPAKEEGIRVTTEKELQEAVADLKISIINITADIALSEDFTYVREENTVTINIKSGKTLTINKSFLGVGGTINNDGSLVVKGSFERGICNLVNNGTVIIENGGAALSGMSDLSNYGSFTVAKDATLTVDRGSQFFNYGELNNEGTILINDGGSMTNNDGTLINNGIIDLYTYYSGDLSLISGTGTLNDYREAAAE